MPNDDKQHSTIHALAAGICGGGADSAINYPWLSWRRLHQSGYKKPITPKVLYAGLPQYVFNIVPTTGIQFFTRQALMNSRLLENKPDQKAFVTALLAGMASAVFTTASERLVYEQVHSPDKNVFHVCQKVRRETGSYLSLWRGMHAFILRDSVYTAAMFYLYDLIINTFRSNFKDAPPQAGIALSAASSGIIATTLTQPMDYATVLLRNNPSQRLWPLLTNEFKERGIKGLYRGYFFRLGGVSGGILVMRSVEALFNKSFAPS